MTKEISKQLEKATQKYVNQAFIDYGDFNEKVAKQIKKAFIDGFNHPYFALDDEQILPKNLKISKHKH